MILTGSHPHTGGAVLCLSNATFSVSEFKDRLQLALDADFLIDREIGGGGMSRVFLATERSLQRRVVIKVLPPELAAGVNVERFRREIQLAAQLQHPHIVPVLAAGDDDNLLWYTMPYIEGESLRGALQRQKRLPVRDVVRILHDVVDALAYAHLRGIVHRDIKPDNILTSGLHALVTDFGVAKALSASIPIAGGTTTGMAIGTPAYMAPEQLAADPAADHRVDIYAIGLLGYELLTGNAPFTGASPQATLAAQLTVTPPAPHTALAAIPEALSGVIMHCLEKDAGKRPQSAQALLSELDALPPIAGRATATPSVSNRRWPLIAAGIVVAAALIMVAQRVRGRAPTAPATTATADRPRDAGPGGDRGTRMEIAVARATDSAAAADSSRPAFRDSATGTGAADGSKAVAVPVTLSRAESLAIMQVMLKRMAAAQANAKPGDRSAASAKVNAPTATSGQRIIVRSLDDAKMEVALDREALLNEVRRIFTDSISQAFARMDSAMSHLPRTIRIEAPPRTATGVVPLIAPPSDGRTRVVVSNFTNGTGKREFSAVGRDAASFLRSALPTDKYDVIDNETTDRAARSGVDRLSLGWGLRADFVVSGVVTQRGDSLSLVTIFTDVRGGRFSRAQDIATPAANAKLAFDPMLAKVNMWLDSAKAMASRMPPRGPRSGAPPEYERR